MDLCEILDKEIVNCKKCERLVVWREAVARSKRKAYINYDYWGKAVPGFGDINGRILVVGLAPGAHGSNRTGRMFTGDASGDFLFPALFRQGFSNKSIASNKGDGLRLNDLFISAICRCVPPKNKPTKFEIQTCIPYLIREIELMENLQVVVCLGSMAHSTVLTLYSQWLEEKLVFPFVHGTSNRLNNGINLVASYHPSRQNTQTGRLTVPMFDNIWKLAKKMIK